MKTAAICLVTFFLIANPFAALSQDEESAKPLYGPGWEVYKPNEDDDDELKIKKEIVLTIQEELVPKQQRLINSQGHQGQVAFFDLLHTYQRMQAAKEAVHVDDKVELIKVANDMLNRALETEENRVLRVNAGIERPDEAAVAKAFRLQCELRLLQLDRTVYEKYKQEKSPAALSKIKQPEIPEVYKYNEDDDEELKIKKEIVRTIQEELALKQRRVSEGRVAVFDLLHTYQRMQTAREAVHPDNKVELIKVAKNVLRRALEAEQIRMLRFNPGIKHLDKRLDDAAEARAFRLQCELRLLQLDRTEYKKYKQPRSLAALSKINPPGIPEIYKYYDYNDKELKIKMEIVRAIQEELAPKQQSVVHGRKAFFDLLHTYQRMQAAKEAVHVDDKVELIKVAKDALNRELETEQIRLARYESGVGRPDEAAEAKAFRLQCELRLLQLDRTEYEKYKQERSQLRKYVHNMIETAKSSEVFSNLDKYQISKPLFTMNPGENFRLRIQVWMIHDDFGQRNSGDIVLKAEFDGSEYQTQEFYYWEFNGKRTNFSVGDQ